MYVYRLNLSSKFSSICIKWCSIEWRNQWISICGWRISWWWSTDLLLRIVKWSSTSDVSCSSSWVHTYSWWRRTCRNCRWINIQTRILFFPFCSSILKPYYQKDDSFDRQRKIWSSYQIFTCVSVNDNDNARLRRSQTERYLVCLNLFSKATNCS